MLKLPNYSILEEILNAVTHGIGVIFAIIASILLIKTSLNDAYQLVSVIIYGITLIVLYLISSVYHALGLCKAKRIFRILDHCSIFLLIAGTYTPICVFVIKGTSGMILLASIWIAATVGIILNAIDLNKFSKFSMVCYIAMGWGVVANMGSLIKSVTNYQLWLLVWGGVVYTFGAMLYGIGKKIKYMHSVWHLFVLAGSILHFMMIYNFIINI